MESGNSKLLTKSSFNPTRMLPVPWRPSSALTEALSDAKAQTVNSLPALVLNKISLYKSRVQNSANTRLKVLELNHDRKEMVQTQTLRLWLDSLIRRGLARTRSIYSFQYKEFSRNRECVPYYKYRHHKLHSNFSIINRSPHLYLYPIRRETSLAVG